MLSLGYLHTKITYIYTNVLQLAVSGNTPTQNTVLPSAKLFALHPFVHSLLVQAVGCNELPPAKSVQDELPPANSIQDELPPAKSI